MTTPNPTGEEPYQPALETGHLPEQPLTAAKAVPLIPEEIA